MRAAIYHACPCEGNRLDVPVAGPMELLNLFIEMQYQTVSLATLPWSPQQTAEEAYQEILTKTPEVAQADVWITSGLFPGSRDTVGAYAAKKLGIPYVLFEPGHRSSPTSSREGVESAQQAISQAELVVTTSSSVASVLSGRVVSKEKVIRLAPYLDTVPWASLSARRKLFRQTWANRYGWNSEIPWVLAWCPNFQGKSEASLDVVLTAIAKLLNLDWLLLIASPAQVTREIEMRCSVFPRSRCAILAELDEESERSVLASSDLLAWPALRDGGVDHLLFSQAAGVPVLTVDSTAVTDRVVQGHTGRIAQANNPMSFAQGLEFLLRQPQFLATFARNCQKQVVDNQDIRTVAQQFKPVFEKRLFGHECNSSSSSSSRAEIPRVAD